MANELPEVVPEVQSMPTTGWFCQTSGNARRRITKNTGSSENGIYDVAGVPGHSHNASAVISVDADYSRYRQTSLSVPRGVWSYDALDLPVGLLTDSVEPTHASERYDRCIERCVGYMSIFPENCAGSIREPTRSIGEIRTLVAPKARLDTLTYLEERRGWVVPVDADDEKQDRALLVSDFPDVHLDMRPLGMVTPATHQPEVVPGSLYIEAPTFTLRVVSDADGLGTIGRLADGGAYTAARKAFMLADVARGLLAPGAAGIPAADALRDSTETALAAADEASAWDGTFRFVWNEEERKYQMPGPVSVVLNDVVRTTVNPAGGVTEQVPTYDWEPNNSDEADGTTTAKGANQAARITVQFPALSTTTTLDGNCWFAAFANEESLANYATRTAGLLLCNRVPVDVIGVQNHVGPFKWVGMPAYRIPVGSAYAHPAPDILPENQTFNHWDKFDAFVQDPDNNGLLKYQFTQQTNDAAATLQTAAVVVLQQTLAAAAPGEATLAAQAALDAGQAQLALVVAHTGPQVFNIRDREVHLNGGMFYKRSGGILQQLTATQYNEQPDFDEDATYPYFDAFDGAGDNEPPIADIITEGLGNTDYHKIFALDPVALHIVVNAATQAIQAANVAIGVALGAQAASVSNEAQPGDPAAYAAATVALILAQGQLATAQEQQADAQAAYAAAITPFTYDNGEYAANSTFLPDPDYSLKGTISFDYSPAEFAATGTDPPDFASDRFAVLPCTPLFYQSEWDHVPHIYNFSVSPDYIGKDDQAAGSTKFVPKAICNCKQVEGGSLVINYDFTDAFSTQVISYASIENAQIAAGGAAMETKLFFEGYSLWLIDPGYKTQIYPGNEPLGTAAEVRNQFSDQMQVGNRIDIEAAFWYVEDVAGDASVHILDYFFATESGTAGVRTQPMYLVTQDPVVAGRRLMMYVPVVMQHIRTEMQGGGGAAAHNITAARVSISGPAFIWDAAQGAGRQATYAEINAHTAEDLFMYLPGTEWTRVHTLEDPYRAIREDSNNMGAVFQSVKRISQHVCAPLVNPNLRIGAQAPLNHDTRHLPPELRDFRLQLQDIDWGRLAADKVTLNELTLYQFKGGNQKQGSQQNVLYLPEFREYKTTITDNTFEFTCYSNLGSPSYYCFFCRSETTDILQQPRIKELSIFNQTTQKKSNSIQSSSIGQLYHLTQRNVHGAAEYDRFQYDRRQTVLLTAEDVGMMGLKIHEYQKAKRVEYVFSGTTDRPGTLYAVLVYNNRGLHIDGRYLKLVTLHE